MRKEIKRNFIKNLKIQPIKIQRKWALERKKKKKKNPQKKKKKKK